MEGGFKGRATIVSALSAAMILAGCGEEISSAREEALILPANFMLSVSDSSKLQLYSLQNGLISEPVEWTSNAPLVASVSDAGVVRALSPGRTTIRGTVVRRPYLTSSTIVDVK